MTEVLVIGAGLSGLALARAARDRGYRCRVLEARHRVGGRALSVRRDGHAYDLGPAWVWPAAQPRIAALLGSGLIQGFGQAETGALRLERDGAAVTVGPFQRQPGAVRIVGGVGALANALARGLDIRFGARVTGVADLGDRLRITAETDTGSVAVEAARAYLALPPRLAAGLVFDPAVEPAVLAVWRATPTWMAGHAKAMALYDRPFWRGAGLSGGAVSQTGPLSELHDASPDGEGGPGAIFGFFGSDAASRARHRCQLEAAVRAQLARLFGPQAAEPRHLIIKDWSRDPLCATGADHAPLPGHPAYGDPALSQPVMGGKLRLIAAEADRDHGGLIEGALSASRFVGASAL